MIISHKHHYLFISVPKTGTHTMYHVLTEYLDGERHGGFHNFKVPTVADNYFKFHTVRNPYYKFASAWSFASNKNAVHKRQIEYVMGKKLELLPFLEWMIKEKRNLIPYALNGMRLGVVLAPTHLWIEQRLRNTKMDAFIQIEDATEQLNALPFVNKYVDVPKVFSTSGQKSYKKWDDIKTPEVIEMINNSKFIRL